jgi:S-adenosylmethionine hydrolase
LYIAPDNGLLGYVLVRCPNAEVRVLDNRELWLEHPSMTFHGRDIMAPAAAHLSMGVPFSEVGPVANSWEPAPFPPALHKGDAIEGHVIHVDRFGNLVTNISGEIRGTVIVGKHRFDRRVDTFAEGASNVPVVLAGSSGWLEVALNDGSAADMMQTGVGTPVRLVLDRT